MAHLDPDLDTSDRVRLSLQEKAARDAERMNKIERGCSMLFYALLIIGMLIILYIQLKG